jgi:hypothetical protein
MKAFRPGLNIRVVTDMDPLRETISVRSSTVYEVHGDHFMIAQTAPPINGTGRDLVVTYLTGHAEGQRRGFTAQVTDIVDYELVGRQHVKALVVVRKNEPSPFSVRMAHRVAPTEDIHLRLFINEVSVEIIDISLKGARFKHSKRLPLKAGTVVNASIDFGAHTYNFKGQVGRTWESDDFMVRKQSAFATVEFTTLNATAERALLHKLRQIERTYIRKLKGWEEEKQESKGT